MTKYEATMQLYIQAFPVVLQDWFKEWAAPAYHHAEIRDMGTCGPIFMREFVNKYYEQAHKNATEETP